MSTPRLLFHNGLALSLNAWARRLGIDKETLRRRLKNHLPPEQAFRGPRRLLQLTIAQAETLADRVEQVQAALDLEADSLAELVHVLLPEVYGDAGRPLPTAARAGSNGKVSALAERARLGRPLWDAGDNLAAEDHGPPEYVLIVRLLAGGYSAAVAEAKGRLGVRAKSGGRGARGTELPAGCSVEAV
jgi:hypothetical protein